MDTIDKAIAKLEELKSGAISGPWTVEDETRTPLGHESAQVYSPEGPIAEASDYESSGDDYASSNAVFDATTAKLIVTLHRTITAQLDVLKAGRVSPAGLTNKNYGAALTLATAIMWED